MEPYVVDVDFKKSRRELYYLNAIRVQIPIAVRSIICSRIRINGVQRVARKIKYIVNEIVGKRQIQILGIDNVDNIYFVFGWKIRLDQTFVTAEYKNGQWK